MTSFPSYFSWTSLAFPDFSRQVTTLSATDNIRKMSHNTAGIQSAKTSNLLIINMQ